MPAKSLTPICFPNLFGRGRTWHAKCCIMVTGSHREAQGRARRTQLRYFTAEHVMESSCLLWSGRRHICSFDNCMAKPREHSLINITVLKAS